MTTLIWEFGLCQGRLSSAYEPWNGYDDYADGSQDIFQKPGIRLAYPNIDYIFSNTIDFDIQI